MVAAHAGNSVPSGNHSNDGGWWGPTPIHSGQSQ